jgi:hypothetical protein
MEHEKVSIILTSELSKWFARLNGPMQKQNFNALTDLYDELTIIGNVKKTSKVNLTDLLYAWNMRSFRSSGADKERLAVFNVIAGKLPLTRSRDTDVSYRIALSKLRQNTPNDRQMATGFRRTCSKLEQYNGNFPNIIIKTIKKEIELVRADLEQAKNSVDSSHLSASKKEIEGMENAIIKFEKEISKALLLKESINNRSLKKETVMEM